MQEAVEPRLFILQLLPSSTGPKLLSLVVDIASRFKLLDLTGHTFIVYAGPKAFSFDDLEITFWTQGVAACSSMSSQIVVLRPPS